MIYNFHALAVMVVGALQAIAFLFKPGFSFFLHKAKSWYREHARQAGRRCRPNWIVGILCTFEY